MRRPIVGKAIITTLEVFSDSSDESDMDVNNTQPSHPEDEVEVDLSSSDIVSKSFDNMTNSETQPLVVLDCANIGWCYGKSEFLIDGIELSLHFFRQFDVRVVAFIPASYIRSKPKDGSRGNGKMETDDITKLQDLVTTNILSIVPAGDDDDSYIISYARQMNGYIISNDHYVDHIEHLTNQDIQSVMKIWLQEYRCGYTFVGNKFFINPSSSLFRMIADSHILSHISTPITPSSMTISNIYRPNIVANSYDNDMLLYHLNEALQISSHDIVNQVDIFKHILMARMKYFIKVTDYIGVIMHSYSYYLNSIESLEFKNQ
jgi:hypothetical protein